MCVCVCVSTQMRDQSRSPEADELRAKLWKQISRATKNTKDGHQLQAIYAKIRARQQEKALAAAAAAAGSAAEQTPKPAAPPAQ